MDSRWKTAYKIQPEKVKGPHNGEREQRAQTENMPSCSQHSLNYIRPQGEQL